MANNFILYNHADCEDHFFLLLVKEEVINMHRFLNVINFPVMAFGIILVIGAPAYARQHFVSAMAVESAQADGSHAAPWSDLQRLFTEEIVKSGDEVVLLDGFFGSLKLEGRKFSKRTFISGQPGKAARLFSLRINDSKNLHLRNLTISPSFSDRPAPKSIIYVGKSSSQIILEGLSVFSAPDVSNWSKSDWNTKTSHGMRIEGNDIELRNNVVSNVDFGITVIGKYTKVIGNEVNRFAGDGLRGLGDHALFEQNTVKNCITVNKNHDDGFQSWSHGKDGKVGTGEVKDVTLRRNLFLAYEDPDQPFRCKMQGIGLFGGMYVNWVIENNIVITDHWHGITVLGAQNVRIVNNTVIDPNRSRPGPAWISIGKHQDGRLSNGNLVANNIAHSFKMDKKGVVLLRNSTVGSKTDTFVDYENGDLRLREGVSEIDSGMPGLGINIDFYGNPRPKGSGIDIGAVESH